MSPHRSVVHCIHPLEPRLLLAAGDLDPFFGSGGFLTGPGAPVEKLITSPSGNFSLTRTNPGAIADLDIIKLLPNGTPDPGFGVNGEAVVGLAVQEDLPIDFVVNGSGQIIVLAQRIDSQTLTNDQYIFRLNPNGTRDNTLNATGEIIVSQTSSIGFNSITVDATGSIYIGGGGPASFIIRKFTPGGPADNAFGTSGTLFMPSSTGAQISDLLIGGGNVTAVGSDFTNSFIFSRNSADGAVNGGFGGGGSVTIGGVSPTADARRDSQGRIVVLGFDGAGGVVARFSAAGNPDSAFGTAGRVQLGATQFESMDIGPNDNISVAGTAGSLLIVRRLLGTNGAPDTSFGSAGGEASVAVPAVVGLPGVPSIVVFPDGSALVGGGDFEIQDTFFVGRLLGDAGTFATLDAATGVLTVTGTPAADQLLIDTQSVTLVAQLGPDQLFFSAAAVTQINIDVGAGADLVTITPTVTAPLTALLGPGNNAYMGGLSNATILGGGGNDSIFAGDGDNLVQGFGGSDSISGGSGDDTIDTGSGGDFADGNDGNDSITGGDGPDFIDGAPGNDTILGRLGRDTLMGATGDDLINGEGGDDNILGGPGNDTLDGAEGFDNVNGNEDDDRVLVGPNGGFATGDEGNDTLLGSGSNDSMFGGIGNDFLQGFAGADNINGGDNDDTIDTGSGGDFADGNNGNDSITGGDGADVIDGAPGNDTIFGRAGPDTLNGADGDDSIMGEEGDDAIIGSAGNDQLFGGIGNDELSGTAGADTLDAGAGNDRVFGGDDDDMLMGGAGFDTLDGQLGADFVSGGDGNDLLISDDGTIDQLNGDQGLDIARGDIDEAYTLVEYLYRFVN